VKEKAVSDFFKAPRWPGRDRPDLERLKDPVPAGSKRAPQSGAGRGTRTEYPVLVTRLDPASVAAEAFRTLRTNLEFRRADRPLRSIAVTSPIAGAGKSTTAANLAVAAAQSGTRVCLVDADLRKPVLHGTFGMPNSGGLAAILKGDLPFSSAVRDTGIPNLSLVVAGQRSETTQGLFTSERVQKLLTEANNHFDLVLYDTPPVLLVADAVHAVALCDGVILVVGWGSIPRSVLQRAVRQITQVKGEILGVLLNRVDLRRTDDDVYRYYRAYYGEGQGR
jgi:capsular exopolysaccharide synthesis family protein